jgi:hypothetical protein
VPQGGSVEVTPQRDPSRTRSLEHRPDGTRTEARTSHSSPGASGRGNVDRSPVG